MDFATFLLSFEIPSLFGRSGIFLSSLSNTVTSKHYHKHTKQGVKHGRKLEEIFNRYKNDTTLEQPELVMAMLTELQDAAGYLSASIQKTAAQTAGVNAGYIAALVKTLPHLHAKPF